MARFIKIISGYKLTEEINRGGFSVCYKGKGSTEKDENYSIQKLYMNKSETYLSQKIRKLKEISNHIHLVTIYDYFFHPEKDKLYIVMQDLYEDNLNDFICKRSTQDTRQPYEKMVLISDMIHGLDFIHKNDIIHGNPAPNNIQIVTVNGHIRCRLCLISCLKMDVASSIYEAPELLECCSSSESSDVFTLGLTFLAMWTEYGAENMQLLPLIYEDGQWKSVVWMLRMEEDISPVLEGMFPADTDIIRLIRGMLCWKPSERMTATDICKKMDKSKDFKSKHGLPDMNGQKTICPQWYLYSDRYDSYRKWLETPDVKVNPRRLWEAGFYYTGIDEEIQCWSCGVKLSILTPDPWNAHHERNPECSLVQRRKHYQDKKVSKVQHVIGDSTENRLKYQIIGEIGRGHLGRVYKASNTARQITLKKCSMFCDNTKLIQSMIKGALDTNIHQNIVTINQAAVSHKAHGCHVKVDLYMELSTVGNLNDYILKEKPGLDEIVAFLKDITNGLKHLHQNDLSHQNLHPKNVLLFQKKSGLVCKISDAIDSLLLTKAGGISFKPFISPFSAPECVNLAFTTAMDVFSVAAIGFAMAAQEQQGGLLVPFLCKFMIATSVMRSTNIYKEIKPYFLNNDKLAKLVAAMLNKDPLLRPNINKVVDVLKDIK